MRKLIALLGVVLFALSAFGQGIPYVVNKNGRGTNTTLQDPALLGTLRGTNSTAIVSNQWDAGNAMFYGADPTGAVDATAKIQSAIDTGRAAYIPPGTYRINGTLNMTGYQYLSGAGGTTILQRNSTAPLFRVSGSRNVLKDVRLSATALQAYTGQAIVFTNGDACTFERLIVEKQTNAIAIDWSFFSRIQQLDMYDCRGFGIGVGQYASANGNTFTIRKMFGTPSPGIADSGSIGIWNNRGYDNTYEGSEITGWETRIKNAGNSRFIGLYMEDATGIDFWQTDDASPWFDAWSARGTIVSTNGGTLYNPAGGLALFQDIVNQTYSFKDLKCLVPFIDGSGTTAVDVSGHTNHLTLTASTWTNGPYYFAVRAEAVNGGTAISPAGIINPTNPFTVAVRYRALSLTNNATAVYSIRDGSGRYIKVNPDPGGYGCRVLRWDGSDLQDDHLLSERIDDRWIWSMLSFDPTNRTVTQLDPVNFDLTQITTYTNVLGPADTITLNVNDSAANYMKLDIGLVAVWQRALTKQEATAFMNRFHSPVGNLSSALVLAPGRVGINTNNPQTELHVVGTATVDGSAKIAGSIQVKGGITNAPFLALYHTTSPTLWFYNDATDNGNDKGTALGVAGDGTAYLINWTNRPIDFYLNATKWWSMLPTRTLLAVVDGNNVAVNMGNSVSNGIYWTGNATHFTSDGTNVLSLSNRVVNVDYGTSLNIENGSLSSQTGHVGTLTVDSIEFATNAVNTGVLPLGKVTFTNLTASISIAGFSGVDHNVSKDGTLVATNGTATDYSITWPAGVSIIPTNTAMVAGQVTWVSNRCKVRFPFVVDFGDTNVAVVGPFNHGN